jgi:hypothetical protein
MPRRLRVLTPAEEAAAAGKISVAGQDSGQQAGIRLILRHLAQHRSRTAQIFGRNPGHRRGRGTGLVAWLQRDTQIKPVIVAGIAQFQLVHIHPFVDGNGRAVRLLSTLCLYKEGYDFKRLFTISEYYDRDRPAYYKALQSVREREWI